VRKYQTDPGPEDYVLFVNKKAIGVIETKREEERHRLTAHEAQTEDYAAAKLKGVPVRRCGKNCWRSGVSMYQGDFKCMNIALIGRIDRAATQFKPTLSKPVLPNLDRIASCLHPRFTPDSTCHKIAGRGISRKIDL
jgi:hypothetical protein